VAAVASLLPSKGESTCNPLNPLQNQFQGCHRLDAARLDHFTGVGALLLGSLAVPSLTEPGVDDLHWSASRVPSHAGPWGTAGSQYSGSTGGFTALPEPPQQLPGLDLGGPQGTWQPAPGDQFGQSGFPTTTAGMDRMWIGAFGSFGESEG
jgi:hypothetical protein